MNMSDFESNSIAMPLSILFTFTQYKKNKKKKKKREKKRMIKPHTNWWCGPACTKSKQFTTWEKYTTFTSHAFSVIKMTKKCFTFFFILAFFFFIFCNKMALILWFGLWWPFHVILLLLCLSRSLSFFFIFKFHLIFN